MVIFRVIAVCGKRIYVFCNGTTSGSYLSWIYSHDSGFSLWYLYCAEHADFRWGKEWIFIDEVCNFIYRKHYYSATWNY